MVSQEQRMTLAKLRLHCILKWPSKLLVENYITTILINMSKHGLSYISILFAGKVSNEAVIKFFGNF